MALTRQQILATIDFLVPLLNDLGKRQMHMDLLFVGQSKRPDIDLHGAPLETTTRMAMRLAIHEIEPGRPALVDLLEQVSREVGFEYQTQIEEWKTALLTPVTPPSRPDPDSPSPEKDFLIPAPFAWITIPAGKVTLEAKNESYLKTETTFDLVAFGLGKYPITVGQYKKFFDMDGYQNRKVWTKAGWKWISQNRDQLFNIKLTSGDTHPVVVTWYEAMAFCAWLSLMTKQRVSLPSEHQWQRAAQGNDKRFYPWGNDWDAKRCNNQGQGFTPVNHYEGVGDSPYGAVDMVGNAAEWTLTNWRTGEQGGDGDGERVLRGGAYDNQYLNFLRATTRHKAQPYTKCGFRLMHLLE